MIVAGMMRPTSVLAATMLAAVRQDEWFSEVSNFHGVRGPILVS